jgi:carboxymethylenebutenolidase
VDIVILEKPNERSNHHKPMLMHLAEEDEFISKPAQAEIKAALGSKPNVTVYSYPGQRHAFSRHNVRAVS